MPWVCKELINPNFLFEDSSGPSEVWWELEESEVMRFGENATEGFLFQHQQKNEEENWKDGVKHMA